RIGKGKQPGCGGSEAAREMPDHRILAIHRGWVVRGYRLEHGVRRHQQRKSHRLPGDLLHRRRERRRRIAGRIKWWEVVVWRGWLPACRGFRRCSSLGRRDPSPSARQREQQHHHRYGQRDPSP
ncbi:hypothetical protein FOZ63_018727, partial [Perkinsus olseni]